jgi:hypothetical protein
MISWIKKPISIQGLFSGLILIISGTKTIRAIPSKKAPLKRRILERNISPLFKIKGKIAPNHTTIISPT